MGEPAGRRSVRSMSEPRLRLGIAGLGQAFMIMMPTLRLHPRIEIAGAADSRETARQQFQSDFDRPAFASVEELCRQPAVDAIYIMTPHQYHAEHAAVAAAHGKHVLVEKPMALDLASCRSMIAATAAAGVQLVVGHTHSFDAPIRRASEIIASGALGAVRMITTLNFTDFLYRPRRPEELVTDQGGGVIFNQAPHQVDIVRLVGGGRVRSVRAVTGAWDRARPTEGAYTAILTFENGAFASITYNGYGHFDSDEFQGWIGESGQNKSAEEYQTARRGFKPSRPPHEEAADKARRLYGGADYHARPRPAGQQADLHHQHFGFVVISCDRADLRPTPRGIIVYGEEKRRIESLSPPVVPRAEVIDEFCDAVMLSKPPLHRGEWGMATMEVCLAILRSARGGREVLLTGQATAG
jgi:phthalate 4,5-cis-dihydrodiol dehydrogenase